MSDKLLLTFREKDSQFGVSRQTLKALSAETGMTETMVIHMAVSRFAIDVLPGYEADDGSLSASDLARVAKAAKTQLPKGKVLGRASLL